MAKPLSLADRIAQAKKENENPGDREKEKSLVKSLSSKDTKEDDGIESGSGRVSGIGSIKGRPSIDTGTGQGRVKDGSISGQGRVSGIESTRPQGRVSGIGSTRPSPKIALADKQQKVYEWLLKNGITGYFNRNIISRETGVTHPTVRKSIKKLEAIGLINLYEYDFASRQQRYDLTMGRCVEILPDRNDHQLSGIGSISGIGSGSGQISGIGSVPTRPSYTSYKKERKILLRNPSISDFWQSHGLTKQKLNSWIDELSFSEEEWNQQLQFGEHEPKVIHADNPIKYFYAALKKGGLTRPNGFEFPEERQARIAEENIKARQKALEKLNKIQQENEVLAEQEAFNRFLEDNNAVEQALKEIEDGYLTPKGRNTIKVYREKGLMDKTLRTKLLTNFKSQE